MTLEKLNLSSDTGTEAISKLDRNQRIIATSINEASQQINVLCQSINIADYIVNGWEKDPADSFVIQLTGKVVTMNIRIKNSVSGTTVNNIFANLPTSIRPSAARFCTVHPSGVVSNKNYDILISTAGLMRFGASTPYDTSDEYINLAISYCL